MAPFPHTRISDTFWFKFFFFFLVAGLKCYNVHRSATHIWTQRQVTANEIREGEKHVAHVEEGIWEMPVRNTESCLSAFTVSPVVSSAPRSGTALNTFEWLHPCEGVPRFTCYIGAHLLLGADFSRSFGVGTTARINHTVSVFPLCLLCLVSL